MPSSAQTILSDLLERERTSSAPHLSASDFFEIFTAEQILKNYGLSYEEIRSGVVDARGGDGAIDSIYTFVNGVLVAEDSEFGSIKQNALITLVIIQSKTEAGFSDEPVLRLEGTARDILDISHSLENYASTYNAQLLRAVSAFRQAYLALLPVSPELQVTFFYASKGDHVHPTVKARAETLKTTVRRIFSEAKVEFSFYGAEELLTLHRKSRVETIPLQTAEAFQTQTMGALCLVRLSDFYEFIHDPDNGELRAWLFEENVRDYEGKNVEVNKGIRRTLENPGDGRDFWWLNNGITIVASKAPMAGKTLTLTDPKIVNGLQTSMEIYNYFRLHAGAEDQRHILARVVVTENEQTRNDIIRATNTQSPIQAASLRAFDPIHYKIEQYFALHDLYYERRKNYYKNLGRPRDKLVTISYLAQAVAAIVMQRPNDSRGRPTTLIKKSHDKVFDETWPVQVFLECVRYMRSIEDYLASDAAPSYVIGHELNVKYHLAMFAAAIQSKRLHITPRFIETYGLAEPSPELLTSCLKHIWSIMQAARGRNKEIDEDRVAKSPELDIKLQQRLRTIRTREVEL